MASSSSKTHTRCVVCKCSGYRDCTPDCIFARNFPTDQELQEFLSIQKVYDANNVAKILNEIDDPSRRAVAVKSLVYEAEWRLRDPVYGCVGLISNLQEKIKKAQQDLERTKKELETYKQLAQQQMVPMPWPTLHPIMEQQQYFSAYQHLDDQQLTLEEPSDAHEEHQNHPLGGAIYDGVFLPCNVSGGELGVLNELKAQHESKNDEQPSGNSNSPAVFKDRGSSSRIEAARRGKQLSRETISQYFYMPLTQAAKELDVGLKLLKNKCRKLGIQRWPYRKLMSLQTLIKDVQEFGEKEAERKLNVSIQDLEQEKKLMEKDPNIQLKEKTKRLRQALFKENPKLKRKVMMGAVVNDSSSQSVPLPGNNTRDDEDFTLTAEDYAWLLPLFEEQDTSHYAQHVPQLTETDDEASNSQQKVQRD